jgi:hypothetical protein
VPFAPALYVNVSTPVAAHELVTVIVPLQE